MGEGESSASTGGWARGPWDTGGGEVALSDRTRESGSL